MGFKKSKKLLQCGPLLRLLRACFSLRFWLGTLSLFGLICVYITYVYVAHILTCVDESNSLENTASLKSVENPPEKSNKIGGKAFRSREKDRWNQFQPHENNVLLQYESLRRRHKSCVNGSCSKVLVDGALYIDANKNITRENDSVILAQNKQWNAIDLALVKSVDREIHHVRPKNILSCNDVNKFWSSYQYKRLQIVKASEKELLSGIVTKRGVLENFFYPKIYPIVTTEASASFPGYAVLVKQYKKRSEIGWNMIGFPNLLGACMTETNIRLITEDYSAEKLCDETEILKTGIFSPGPCFHLIKLNFYISKQEDPTKAALSLSKSIICFIAELEKRKLFLETLHGSNIHFQRDMSIIVDSWESAVHYENNNLWSGSTCWYDRDCKRPDTYLWSNVSANVYTHRKCNEIKFLCRQGRCVGINAKMHLCGVGSWILMAMVEHVTRIQDKRNLLKVLSRASTREPSRRQKAEEICSKLIELNSAYDGEMNAKFPGYPIIPQGQRN